MTHRAAEFGLKFEGLELRLEQDDRPLRDVSDKIAAGIEFLFKKNKIDYLRGEGRIDKAGKVKVTASRRQRGDARRAPNILIATGCVAARRCRASRSTARPSSAAKEAMILRAAAEEHRSSSARARSAWSSPISSTPSAPR